MMKRPISTAETGWSAKVQERVQWYDHWPLHKDRATWLCRRKMGKRETREKQKISSNL